MTEPPESCGSGPGHLSEGGSVQFERVDLFSYDKPVTQSEARLLTVPNHFVLLGTLQTGEETYHIAC